METAIKKSDATRENSQDDLIGPMMVWTKVRSEEELKEMSDWVAERKREIEKEPQ